MEVTDVRLRKLMPEGKMKAIVSVTLDNAFVVHDVKVVDGENGLFVAMPSRRTAAGGFRDVAHPISQQSRDVIQSRVLAEYWQFLADQAAVSALSATVGTEPDQADHLEPEPQY